MILKLGASIVAAISVATGGAAEPRKPMPLRGVPLAPQTGLRLLVADKPPFVLDVDSGSVTAVRGVPEQERGTLGVLGVGGRGAVVVAESEWRHADIYSVRGRGARVASLGTGAMVTPAADGRSVWVKSFVDESRCTLRHVGLDGRELGDPQESPVPRRSTREARSEWS